MATASPEEFIDVGIMGGSQTERVSMSNHLFLILCDILNDPSPSLRAKALLLMGTLSHTSQSILLQTLNKTITAPPKRITSRWQETPATHTDGGDFDISAVNTALTTSSMCGAFIHGLEDEFAAVRSSAVDTICELACTGSKFADMSIPYLVDMFNDDHKDIRLNALISVRKVSYTWKLSLKDALLQTVMLCLFDADIKIRFATHKLLGDASIQTEETLVRVIEVLRKARETFPSDLGSILKAHRQLGQAHPSLVGALIPRLLRLDPRFLAQAIRSDDMNHVTHLILIFSACSAAPELIASLPGFAKEQYMLLRETYSYAIPNISSLAKSTNIAHDSSSIVNTQMFDIRKTIELLLSHKRTAFGHSKSYASPAASQMARDLNLLAQRNAPRSVLYDFINTALLNNRLTRAAKIKVVGPTRFSLCGHQPLSIPCQLHLVNIDDLSVVTIEVPGYIYSLVGQPAVFERPMEWTVDMDIVFNIGHANGAMDVNLVCKIGQTVASTATIRLDFT
eukprot:jgi/Hompol1/579/HPOL_005357-RA